MTPRTPFNAMVRARTRAAEFVLSHPELLAAFLAHGGLEADLAAIAAAGRRAEAANLAQSGRFADGKAATVDVTTRFAALQREYKAIMAVLRAVLRDLRAAGASHAVVAAVERILVNETDVAVPTTPDSSGANARRVRKRESQDAIRAEIQRDAAALVGLEEVHAALGARRVGRERLLALVAEAEALHGLLATRVAKKAERQAATSEEYAAAKAQSDVWRAVYRLLARVDDPRMTALMKAARA
jgi:hypothetical protein